MTDKVEEIRVRHLRDDRWRNTQSNEDRAYLLAEVDRLRAMLPPTAHSGVRNGPGEGSWSVFSEKVVEERDSARAEVEKLSAEIERLKQEPELLRAELISLTNAARKALADAYNRARETRDAFIEWRDVR